MQVYHFNPNLSFIKDTIKGNLYINGQYVFEDYIEKIPYQNLIRWLLNRNPQFWQKRKDTFVPNVICDNKFATTDDDKIVWLGHSSFYIQLNNTRILTDPVFYSLAPIRMQRRHALPCKIENLQPIDYILLSHGHRDHLDIPSLRALLKNNPNTTVFCPLGFESLLRRIGFKNIQEAAWWQRYQTHKTITIDFLPAKHWNRRTIFDFNTTLWGSFAISTPKYQLYFAGDTAYSSHFKTIQEHYHYFDVSLLPIGAYKPRFIMEWAHTSPEEAVQAANDLHTNTVIPMHYGTYDLSDEPASEPLLLLQQAKQDNALNAELKILAVGETFLC